MRWEKRSWSAGGFFRLHVCERRPGVFGSLCKVRGKQRHSEHIAGDLLRCVP